MWSAFRFTDPLTNINYLLLSTHINFPLVFQTLSVRCGCDISRLQSKKRRKATEIDSKQMGGQGICRQYYDFREGYVFEIATVASGKSIEFDTSSRYFMSSNITFSTRIVVKSSRHELQYGFHGVTSILLCLVQNKEFDADEINKNFALPICGNICFRKTLNAWFYVPCCLNFFSINLLTLI